MGSRMGKGGRVFPISLCCLWEGRQVLPLQGLRAPWVPLHQPRPARSAVPPGTPEWRCGGAWPCGFGLQPLSLSHVPCLPRTRPHRWPRT